MSRFIKGAVAAITVSAMLGLPLTTLAQDAPAPQAPSTQAPAARDDALPPLIQGLNLTDTEIREGRRGVKTIKGDLADGTEIRAFYDSEGTVHGVIADDDAALPQAVIDQLVPEAVRSQDILGQIATISGVFSSERGVMIAGEDAEGEDVRAGFSADGTLMRFGRGDGDDWGGKRHHGRWGGGPEGHGKGSHGKDGRGKGEHGKKSRDDDDDDGSRRGDRRGPPAVSDDAARAALEASGYTRPGEITREGPRTFIAATNPQGEAVQVEISPRGEVVRESVR